MTPKYRLVPETPTEEMLVAADNTPARPDEWDSLTVIHKAMLSAAPPMDYISGEEIRKLVAEWRSIAIEINGEPEPSMPHQICADELEKLLKGECK